MRTDDHFAINVSTAELEAHRSNTAFGDVWAACDRWLRARGLRTDGERMHEQMNARRNARRLAESTQN